MIHVPAKILAILKLQNYLTLLLRLFRSSKSIPPPPPIFFITPRLRKGGISPLPTEGDFPPTPSPPLPPLLITGSRGICVYKQMGERGGEGVGKSPSVGGGNMLRLVESDCGVYKKKRGG